MIFAVYLSLFSYLPLLVCAQGQFTQPDGNEADLSQTFVVGTTEIITWNAGWEGVGTPQKFADLFLTSFGPASYISLIAKNQSLESDGEFRWTIDLTNKDVNDNPGGFVLRFVQARVEPVYAASAEIGMSPSRGFKLRISSSSTSSSSLSSATASPSTAPSTPSASTSNIPETKDKASTPVGAIVGGVLGGLALIILGLISFLMLRRRRANEPIPYHDQMSSSFELTAEKYGHVHHAPQELPGELAVHEVETKHPRH